jgi:hypothetical protein
MFLRNTSHGSRELNGTQQMSTVRITLRYAVHLYTLYVLDTLYLVKVNLICKDSTPVTGNKIYICGMRSAVNYSNIYRTDGEKGNGVLNMRHRNLFRDSTSELSQNITNVLK